MPLTTATSAQAWAILARHARDEISHLRLQELCSDEDRVSSLVAVHSAPGDRILLIDLSRQRLSLETMNHLLRLANASDVPKYIKKLAWGQNDPDNPVVPASKMRNSPRGSIRQTRFFEPPAPPGASSSSSSLQNAEKPKLMPTMHFALRAPARAGLVMLTADGNNALTGIHRDWERIERFSDSVRKGQLKGATGAPIRNIIVVGRGVPVMALQFVYEALLRDAEGLAAATEGIHDSGRSRHRSNSAMHRRMRFLTSLDPLAAASTVQDLDPASTMIISIAVKGTEETFAATRTLKNWLLQGIGHSRRSDIIFTKHMLLVTGSERFAATNKPETVFLIPSHSRCEPFTTFTAATLLPLSIVFGWPIVKEFLAGAHNMDTHFVESNPRHNLPLLLALTDVWNDAFLGSSGRVLTPCCEIFSAFPQYVAAMESQTSGKMTDATSRFGASSCSGMVVDGGLSGIYDKVLYQGSRVVPSEIIMAMDTQVTVNTGIASLDGADDVTLNQDALICACFAHADELAFGSEQPSSTKAQASSGMLPRTESFNSTSRSVINTEASDGNRPSSLIICRKCDAFACGQLIALSEHRAVIKAKMFDVDPFAEEVGSSLRAKRTEDLKEELHKLYTRISTTGGLDDDDEDESNEDGTKVNLSTSTILGHYATMTHDQRVYVVKGS